MAINSTVPGILLKFLKYLLVTFVFPFHAVDGVTVVPCFAVVVSSPVAVHPANVCACLVGSPIYKLVIPFAFPFNVIVFV